MPFLTLGDRYGVDDRGAPGNVSGWGTPSWAKRRVQMGLVGPMKPMKVGARYFCGDCYPLSEDSLVAQGDKFSSSKLEYQAQVTQHYDDHHPDLHYPLDQTGLDAMQAAKTKADSILRQKAELKKFAKWGGGVGGGVDLSGEMQPVSRPRELPDFTEFDWPDANVADDGVEEIEFDQLISIAARQGRRFLGVEMQNIDAEIAVEFATAADNADLDIGFQVELNTRTGAQNLDDPENLWRFRHTDVVANIESTAGTGTAINAAWQTANRAPPGGIVYVSPRLFWRFTNTMDRQIDTGDLFARIATITQPLSTFLLFELLEQYSGLFGFAA